ncbi:MAG TPA: hypothetical protein VE690_10665, partial [Rhodopila sp.]|nr:hypothetical protein [Rhodopila sp.]
MSDPNMSDPNIADPRLSYPKIADPDLTPDQRVVAAILRRLIAFFLGPDLDADAAYAAALEALLDYRPAGLTEYLAAARHIALSFAALVASAKAIDPATAEKPQLQFLTKANTLSRTAQQTEAALARRPSPQPAAQPTPQPATRPAAQPAVQPAAQSTARPAAEPALHYLSNEEADALVNSVMASYLAKRQRADAPLAQPAPA